MAYGFLNHRGTEDTEERTRDKQEGFVSLSVSRISDLAEVLLGLSPFSVTSVSLWFKSASKSETAFICRNGLH